MHATRRVSHAVTRHTHLRRTAQLLPGSVHYIAPPAAVAALCCVAAAAVPRPAPSASARTFATASPAAATARAIAGVSGLPSETALAATLTHLEHNTDPRYLLREAANTIEQYEKAGGRLTTHIFNLWLGLHRRVVKHDASQWSAAEELWKRIGRRCVKGELSFRPSPASFRSLLGIYLVAGWHADRAQWNKINPLVRHIYLTLGLRFSANDFTNLIRTAFFKRCYPALYLFTELAKLDGKLAEVEEHVKVEVLPQVEQLCSQPHVNLTETKELLQAIVKPQPQQLPPEETDAAEEGSLASKLSEAAAKDYREVLTRLDQLLDEGDGVAAIQLVHGFLRTHRGNGARMDRPLLNGLLSCFVKEGEWRLMEKICATYFADVQPNAPTFKYVIKTLMRGQAKADSREAKKEFISKIDTLVNALVRSPLPSAPPPIPCSQADFEELAAFAKELELDHKVIAKFTGLAEKAAAERGETSGPDGAGTQAPLATAAAAPSAASSSAAPSTAASISSPSSQSPSSPASDFGVYDQLDEVLQSAASGSLDPAALDRALAEFERAHPQAPLHTSILNRWMELYADRGEWRRVEEIWKGRFKEQQQGRQRDASSYRILCLAYMQAAAATKGAEADTATLLSKLPPLLHSMSTSSPPVLFALSDYVSLLSAADRLGLSDQVAIVAERAHQQGLFKQLPRDTKDIVRKHVVEQ